VDFVMSTFAVHVVRVAIEPHDNADALEIARVGDYRSRSSARVSFRAGTWSRTSRSSRCCRRRCSTSWGCAASWRARTATASRRSSCAGCCRRGWCIRRGRLGRGAGRRGGARGAQVGAAGPAGHMNGVVLRAGPRSLHALRHRELQGVPGGAGPDEAVVFTEKIHGTWCQIGYLPPSMIDEQGHLVVSSKGLAGKGLAFRPDAPENADNLYLRVARGLDSGPQDQRGVRHRAGGRSADLRARGGVRGGGAGPAGTGARTRRGRSGFACSTSTSGARGRGAYLGDEALERACAALGLPRVPVLYRGPFTREVMLTLDRRQGERERQGDAHPRGASWSGPAESSGATQSSGGCSSRACRRSTCCVRTATEYN
jgi:hypothetical protein